MTLPTATLPPPGAVVRPDGRVVGGTSSWAPAAFVLGSLGAVGVAQFSSTAAMAFAAQADPAADGVSLAQVGAWVIGLGLGASLLLRTRFPFQVGLATAIGAVLLPLDSVAALIALPWVIARRSAREAWWCGGLTALGTALALARDRARPPGAVLLAGGDAGSVLSPLGYGVVGVLCLAVAVGAGLARRWHGRARDAIGRQHAQERVSADLRTEMTRQEERELIAREVHDTVAHHLSLVSLSASALEVGGAASDGDVRESARTMRASAHQALEELRDLVALVRDPAALARAGGAPLPSLSLAELPELLDHARDAGADVRATVVIQDGATAPAVLTRAVYRIVQESLTNVLKHAPGAPVQVDLRAAPGAGVRLRVTNPMALSARDPRWAAGPADAGPGGGAGIVGMRERAGLAGGTLTAEPAGTQFVVSATLPWPAPAKARVGAST
ncbi:sensor histidine kinase [Actinotalea sp.]|uniref:sensor histidine kinase n=1 Tax=Actinotalea sp. TaxID=1872145 RepID=UPI0035662E8F